MKVISQEVILFDGERIHTIVHLELLVITKKCCLILRSRQACHTLLALHLPGHIFAQVLQCDVVAGMFELACVTNNFLRARKHTEMSDALIGYRRVYEFARLLYIR